MLDTGYQEKKNHMEKNKKDLQFNNMSLKHRPTQCYYHTEHISPCRYLMSRSV